MKIIQMNFKTNFITNHHKLCCYLLACCFTMLFLPSCSDLEPRAPLTLDKSSLMDGGKKDATSDKRWLSDVADQGLSGEKPSADAKSTTYTSWTTECIDLPDHVLYDTGCQESLACLGGQLSEAWSGPSGSLATAYPDSKEKLVKNASIRIDCAKASWCGVTFECPSSAGTAEHPNVLDLSTWQVLHIAFKGSAPEVEIKLSSPPGNDLEDWRDEAAVNASAYGYQADNQWHQLAIPLKDFKQSLANIPHHPFNLNKVFKPLIISLAKIEAKAAYVLNVDAVYFTK